MRKVLLLVLLFLPVSAFADVTFYGQCDYKGPGVTLDAGQYGADDLRQVGIPEDAIASVKVSDGVSVTVFEHDGFKGRYGTLNKSDSCLNDDGFDNLISSLVIKQAAAFGTANSNSATPLIDELKPRTNTAQVGKMVTVYADCDYAGVSAKLPVGDYNLAELKRLGLGNNEISSVKVPAGLTLNVFENDFLRGASGSATGDIQCLDNSQFAGKITSLSVAGENGSSGLLQSSPTSQAKSSSGGGVARMFTECSYKGASAQIGVGEYTSSQLQALGLPNNSISAIQIADGYEAELFLNDFYRGKNGVLGKNNPCLVGEYNNAISSLVVRKKASAGAGFAPPVATLYLHCNYRGASAKLAIGRHSEQQLKAARIDTNTVSSIKLAKGYKAVLYDSADFSGKGVTISADDDCLDDNNLNEMLSSIIITPVGASTTASSTSSSSNFTAQSNAQDNSNQLVEGLQCVEDFVEKGVCDESRWNVMERRCGLAKVPELSDGYLQGHVNAGNCNAELWNELVRRTANPHLR